ncbi:hypothetical protein L195_g062170, partial [Trifolium pratense]
MRLDDVSCQIHLLIKARLLNHSNIMNKAAVVNLKVNFIGLDLVDAAWEVTTTKEAHAQFAYQKSLLQKHFRVAHRAERDEDEINIHMY